MKRNLKICVNCKILTVYNYKDPAAVEPFHDDMCWCKLRETERDGTIKGCSPVVKENYEDFELWDTCPYKMEHLVMEQRNETK